MLPMYKSIEDLHSSAIKVFNYEKMKSGMSYKKFFNSKIANEVLESVYGSNLEFTKEELSEFMDLEVKAFKYSFGQIWATTYDKQQPIKVVDTDEAYKYIKSLRDCNKLNLELSNKNVVKKVFKM